MNHSEEQDAAVAYWQQSIADWLSGDRPMTTPEARDLERRLGLPREWLDRRQRRARPARAHRA